MYGAIVTKMVQLADDAYESLRRSKLPGESFSQTVRRLTRPRASLLALGDLDITEAEHDERMRRLAEVDGLDRADAERAAEDAAGRRTGDA